ncbi:MAG: hypothetical protein C5B57_02140 [Blastocatellia bacterium]|nr:MAG: hypothetical protein C5B57_02140 [Blastocatellia bacterium]
MKCLVVAGVIATATGITAYASSHREAPGITKTPKVDGTDFYMFRSYEPGRSDYVTLLANYLPLQDVYGGPNFFTLDPDAVYEIHIDNNGDAREDITFQFRFRNQYKNLTVPAGGRNVAVPLVNIGGIGPNAEDTDNLNLIETYSVDVIRGDRRQGSRQPITDASSGAARFRKPVDRIGDKSLPSYAQYADRHIYNINIPGCSGAGRVFVGQRREGFVVNLAEAFDLINLDPLGPVDGRTNVLADKNVTTLALEVPISCLVNGDPVIGGWTTASVVKKDRDRDKDVERDGDSDDDNWASRHEFDQMSRLSAPLVNELVIGIKDKDKFNASEPKDDARFAKYVTNPTLPVLIEALFGVPAPATPRVDLVQVFLTGVPSLNQPATVKAAEMMRLNTTTPVVEAASQNSLGVIGGDTAGFPNGRRPGDDVVDIALRAVEGILLPGHPAAIEGLTDGAFVKATIAYTPDGTITADQSFRLFRDSFPYLQTPLSGSPGPEHP